MDFPPPPPLPLFSLVEQLTWPSGKSSIEVWVTLKSKYLAVVCSSGHESVEGPKIVLAGRKRKKKRVEEKKPKHHAKSWSSSPASLPGLVLNTQGDLNSLVLSLSWERNLLESPSCTKLLFD